MTGTWITRHPAFPSNYRRLPPHDASPQRDGSGRGGAREGWGHFDAARQSPVTYGYGPPPPPPVYSSGPAARNGPARPVLFAPMTSKI